MRLLCRLLYSTDALGIQELYYNVMLFFCFSIIVQEENLKDPRPLEGLKAVRFEELPGSTPLNSLGDYSTP